MNKLLYLILYGIVFFSCAEKKKEQQRGDGEWKELESFHKIMAEVYHPMKESGNLAPAKKLIHQLADEADTWASSELPEEINTPAMKEQLQKLKTYSRNLAEEIDKGATGESIKDKLNQLHEVFHQIRKDWFKARETQDEDHDHQ